MNILFYQHQYPAFGGIETVTTILANSFAEDGHNVAIVSFIHKSGTDLLNRLNKKVAWHELPEGEINADGNRTALLKILRNFKPDKIIFQDSYANIQYLLWSALVDWRGQTVQGLIVVEHSAPRWSPGRRTKPLSVKDFLKQVVLFLLKPYFKYRRFRYESHRRCELFDKADAYVILSKNYEQAIRRLVGSERLNKLHVIPNPSRSFNIDNNVECKRKQILFVGSLIHTKGVEKLLSVWSVVAFAHPDWEFVIVGDGVLRQELESLVESKKIPRVRFAGFKKNPTVYYKQASIFVMASIFEGWPMVLGEAMSQGGVPVVYDSFAAALDIIDDGINGCVGGTVNRCGTAQRLCDILGFGDILGGKVAVDAEIRLDQIYILYTGATCSGAVVVG